MATDYINEVQKLYVSYFSRPADTAGLSYWANQLEKTPGAYQLMSSAFSTSAEYRAAYAGMDNAGVVREVYDNLFGRVAEQAGVDYWANLLNNNQITIDNVVTQIATGSLGNDRVAYNGKVAVATAFTERLDTSAEVAAYTGTNANSLAAAYVAGVKDLTSAAQHMDPGQIDAVIAAIVGNRTGVDAIDIPLA